MADDCIFCQIIAGDMPSEQIDSDERTFTFMDIRPATRGHLLVVPKTHSTDLHEIDLEDLAACAKTAQRMAARIRDRLDSDGVNLLNCCGAAAWQTVFHFHVHVIPRWEDDPLQLPWIPKDGEQSEIAAAASQLRD
ncbi:MAG: HIT family protein [Solirubrobacterales bacterium]